MVGNSGSQFLSGLAKSPQTSASVRPRQLSGMSAQVDVTFNSTQVIQESAVSLTAIFKRLVLIVWK